MGHIVQAVTIPWYNACADYAVMLALGLKTLGHRVTVAGGEGAPALARAREKGLETLESSGKSDWNVFSIFRRAKQYRRYAIDQNVTAVNVHHGRDHSVWAIALRGTGIPIVRTSGNQIPPNVHPGSRYLLRCRTAGVIATCATIRNYYADGFGLKPETVPVINGGVDCSFYSPDHPRNVLRAELGIPGDAFLFGIIGRFSPVKGHRYFFEAAGKTARTAPGAWFVVAGWDAQLKRHDIVSMARQAGIIERTRFTGRQDDIRDLIASIDAGVIASVGSETVCRIAMEYMAMGTPVVATDTNVIPEVICHEQAGIVTPKGNPEAMASAMEKIAASRQMAEAFGRAGRSIAVREYSLEQFAAKTLNAYRKMMIHV